jgi:RNA polymerase sigma-70 factor (ECF subfamily)
MWFAARSGRSTATKPHPAEAFEKLSLEQLDGLYNFALHQSSDSSTAEKLVVKTYLRARSRFERLPEGTNFKLWIFKVLRNAAIRQRKNGWLNRLASEANDKVDSALARLPETHRLAVVLFAVEDFTCRDIADILDSRPGNVVVWLDTARRRLGLNPVTSSHKEV